MGEVFNLGLQIADKCISDTPIDCKSIACIFLINIFFCEYYGLVINVYEIASHKLVPMRQDIRGMETTCALSINIISNYEKLVPDPQGWP